MCKPAKTSWDGSFWAMLALAAVVDFAVGLWAITRWLYRATVWAAPRVYRLARHGYRSARHRWVTRPVVLDRKPAAALPQQPTGLTLRDLRLKEPANR